MHHKDERKKRSDATKEEIVTIIIRIVFPLLKTKSIPPIAIEKNMMEVAFALRCFRLEFLELHFTF